jgi:hypothetical protein
VSVVIIACGEGGVRDGRVTTEKQGPASSSPVGITFAAILLLCHKFTIVSLCL